MTDTTAQEFNFDAFMYGVRRDSPFDGSTLADSISNDEVRRAESAFNSLLKRAEKAEAELAALKGEQVPVAWLNDAHLARGHIEGEAGEEDAGPGMIPVYRERFTAPQKPVTHPDKLRMDWLCAHVVEVRQPLMYGSHAMFYGQCDSDDCEEYHTTLREQIDAAIEATGGIVKDGE